MDKKNTPEVKLGQYKGLAVTRHVRPVTDKTVDIELVHQTRMHAVYHPTTEPAKRGFRALLDFAGYMDGKEIPDSRMEKVMVVLGDGKLMPAAEQAIYGHRAGEVFRFDFTYPQDFRLPELSGKTAQFEIELRSLAEKVTPAPDEAFARSLGFDSLDALKADLRAKKQKIHEEGADRAAGKQLLDMAGANMTVDLPAEILDRTAQNEMKLLKERLSRSTAKTAAPPRKPSRRTTAHRPRAASALCWPPRPSPRRKTSSSTPRKSTPSTAGCPSCRTPLRRRSGKPCPKIPSPPRWPQRRCSASCWTTHRSPP